MRQPVAPVFFSQCFGVDPEVLESYGALDVCVVSDLPLFVDPFLLFNSDNPEYQRLHEEIVRYVVYLRDRVARDGPLGAGQVQSLCRFPEIKENWLGLTYLGNRGSGLGTAFAEAMHAALTGALKDFGDEERTASGHLEKLALIQGRVGRDNISDFTTNLIHGWLLSYTETFAREYLSEEQRITKRVARAEFNYETGTWCAKTYELPHLGGGEHILLTPVDILTKDATWINHGDMISANTVRQVIDAVPDAELKASLNDYLARRLDSDLTEKQRREVRDKFFRDNPWLVDVYIRLKEESGEEAQALSAQRRTEVEDRLIEAVQQAIGDLHETTAFYAADRPDHSAFEECLRRAKVFKHYVEHQDGYLLLNRDGGFASEKEVQLFLGLVFHASPFDVNREVNNGRGPVDEKVSFGAQDSALLEVKLGSNGALKRNLENQVDVYRAANTRDGRVPPAVKVIVVYTASQQARVDTVLRELGIAGEPSIIVIDARKDNKPSASVATEAPDLDELRADATVSRRPRAR